MNLSGRIKIICILLLSIVSLKVNAQDESSTDEDNSSGNLKGAKGFHIGFYLGGYFANNYSTNLYDGSGYDLNGNKNDISNSIIYRRIVLENDGSAYPDRIKDEVGVTNHEDWSFEKNKDGTDMPQNLKYNTAFLFGLALHYGLTTTQAIIANLNFAKLTAVGNFTIETTSSFNQPIAHKNNYFPIVGNEQRLMIQLGYSQILGKNPKFNFFVEGGLCINQAKFLKNFLQINNLELDLTSFNNLTGYNNTFVLTEQYTGWGFGGFAGFGFNLSMNPKYTIQILYTPSYETINIGNDPTAKLQQAAGLRAYYNF